VARLRIALRIALFGGTFNPIHNAHLTIARQVAQKFRLDRVMLIPAGNPPHKQDQIAPYEHRLRMVQLACAEDPVLIASDLERGTQRSYSILTVQKVLAQQGVQQPLFFVIGSDAFAELPTWYRWQELIQLVQFIVVCRPGFPLMAIPGAAVHLLPSIRMPISSTDLRRRLACGERPELELPPPVLDYIRQHGLYLHPQPDEAR
jgi:nicotinate-nucleotide adenylyltransferase